MTSRRVIQNMEIQPAVFFVATDRHKIDVPVEGRNEVKYREAISSLSKRPVQ